jgi:predicted ArsR family transcriptional regulator
VTQRPVRRGPHKPSSGYSLTGPGEALFPKRYEVLLNAVLRDIEAEHAPGEVVALYRRLGHQIAARAAPRVLGELGGAAVAEDDPGRPGGTTIVGRSCPIGAVVAEHPDACGLLEAFLAEALPEATVREVCHKGDAPHCRFEVDVRRAR